MPLACAVENLRKRLIVQAACARHPHMLTSPKSEGPVSRPLLMSSTAIAAPAARTVRPAPPAPAAAARRELVEHAAAGRRQRAGAPGAAGAGPPLSRIERRLAVEARQDRQEQAGGEEQRRQDRGRAGQHVGGAAARS